MEIDTYYIDDNNTLHTFIGEYKHITFEDVYTLEQAEELINEENSAVKECMFKIGDYLEEILDMDNNLI